MDSPNFSNPQQERIYRRLNSLVGPGAAAFWRDACRLMEMEPSLESTTHFVGHSLREIESSLRAVLKPFWEPSEQPSKKKKASGDDTHKAQIKAVLQALEIPETSDVARTWLSLPGRNSEYGLHRRAHRDDLASPRPVDEKFRQFWSDIQAVLDQVLDRFETRYSDIRRLLDKLLTKSEPEKKDLDTLRLYIPNSRAGLGYFFEQLKYPGWLNLLEQEGFFENPPEPEVDLERGGIGFPLWSQSRYLARMASQEPEIVLEIALEILKTGTKNILVHGDLAEAACGMQPKLAASWVKQETEWLKEQNYLNFRLPQKLGELIAYLAESEQVDAALGLARELLAVMPNQEGDYLTPVRTRCDDYYYEKILAEYIPKLVSVAEEETLGLLCDLLRDAIRLFQLPHEQSTFEDNSCEWYCAFEGTWQNYRHDVRSILVAAVWNATEQIASKNPDKIRFLVQKLEDNQWQIFYRIVLHLLRCFPQEYPDLIAERLANRDQLNQQIPCYEYKLLLKEHFAQLEPRVKKTILGWIAEGLEDTSWIKEEKIILYIKHWQRDWLAILSSSLPKEWQQKYEQLVREIGFAESLEPPGGFNVWQGPTSPKSAEELAAMSMTERFTFLKEWQPAGKLFAPSRSGLAGELSKVIAQKPENFIEEIEQFKEVDPEYMIAFLQGLQENLRNHSEVQPILSSWEPVFEFCSWMLNQLKNESESKDAINGLNYGQWDQVCRAVVYLIDVGLKKNQIPFKFRNQIWIILEQLTNDPCSQTMTVIQYALWVQQHLLEKSDGEVKTAPGFDEIPKARNLLERHLDPKHDPSLTIRSVYGQYLLYLMQLDLDWTTRNLERIFPRDTDFQEFRDSAWEGYITTNNPYNNIFPILREEYSYAIERIDTSIPEWQNLSRANERLTEHLRALYWCGVLKLGESDLLLEQFFAKAPAHNRQAFMRQIAWQLRHGNCEVDNNLRERLQRLWEWRFSEINSKKVTKSQADELKYFSWWFVSRKFDDSWAINQLVKVLKISGIIQDDLDLLKHFLDLAESMPLAIVKCLKSMTMAPPNSGQYWLDSDHHEEHRAILSAVLNNKDEQTRKAAKELINRLLVRGVDFKDLLPEIEA